jgi:hypothetical protein
MTRGAAMNDDDLFGREADLIHAVRDGLDPIRMKRPAETLMASGRARRMRRWLSGAVTAGVTLAVGLAVLANGPAMPQVHVRMASWSVNTNPNGTVTFTAQNISDPARLQQALARAGVPALVRYGEICTAPHPLDVYPQIRHYGPTYLHTIPWFGPFEWVIKPSAMPAGTLWLISEGLPEHTSKGFGAPVVPELIKRGSPLACEPAHPPYPSPLPHRDW